MNINRNNYEEFFLLYADNELSAADRLAVETFAEENPDLKAELEMLMLTIQPSDEQVRFAEKENLYRTTELDQPVNMTNYESWFVQYTDNELDNQEKAATEEFVYRHPELQSDFELFQKTRVSPDTSIRFPDKSKLLRREKAPGATIISIRIRYAAAAALILLAGITWIWQNNNPLDQPKLATVTGEQVKSSSKSPVQPAATTEAPAAATEGAATDVPATETPDQYPAADPSGKYARETAVPAAGVLAAYRPETSGLKETDPSPVAPVNLPSASLPTAGTQSLAGSPDVEMVKQSGQPDLKIDKAIYVETESRPNVFYAVNAADEETVFSPGKNLVRKTPLRGIIRKASRFIDKNNPLSDGRQRGGVFTASNDQQ